MRCGSWLSFQLFRDYPLGKAAANDLASTPGTWVSNYSEIIPSVRLKKITVWLESPILVSNYSEIIPSVRRSGVQPGWGIGGSGFQLFRDYPLGKVTLKELICKYHQGFQLFRDYPLGKEAVYLHFAKPQPQVKFPTIPRLSPR